MICTHPTSHLLPAPCLSFPFLPSGTGESCGCGCPRTTLPRPINGDSCPRLDGKLDGRDWDRSTGVSSCGSMRNGLDDGATSPGPVPLRYGDDEAIGGTRICHLGVAKTELTLAPTRIPRDGVDVGSNGEISSWNMRSSAPGVVYTRTRSVVALLLRGVWGPFRDPKDDRVYASAVAARAGLVFGVVGPGSWGWIRQSIPAGESSSASKKSGSRRQRKGLSSSASANVGSRVGNPFIKATQL